MYTLVRRFLKTGIGFLGVGLWMLPRPDKGDTRYTPRLAEVAYWLLAAGTAGRVLGEIVRVASSGPWLRWLVLVCGLMQVAGIGVFFFTMWTRVRPVGSQHREAKGERF